MCWCVEGFRLCCVEGWCVRLLKLVLQVGVLKIALCCGLVCSCVESCVVFRLVCWYVEGCVEDWCVGVLKVVLC